MASITVQIGQSVTHKGSAGTWVVVSVEGNSAVIQNAVGRKSVLVRDLEPAKTTYATVARFPNLTEAYKALDAIEQSASEKIKNHLLDFDKSATGKLDDKNWFGEPLPANLKEMKDRKTFQRMDLYKEVKEEIKKRTDELKKKSMAELFEDKLVYNSLEVGVFDFARASTILLPKFQYYSLKKKAVVPYADVIIVEEDGNYVYREIKDKTKCVVIPITHANVPKAKLHKIAIRIDKGENVYDVMNELDVRPTEWYSTVKKSFLYKEKLPRPKNAVRIFTMIGGLANRTAKELMWTGMTAVALAEMLEQIGYSVNLVMVEGNKKANQIWNPNSQTHVTGVRFITYDLKRFDETLDVKSILYTTADPTYYRYKSFRNVFLMDEKYNDIPNSGIGNDPTLSDLKNAVYKSYMPKDPNTEILYFVIGLIFSEEEAMRAIQNIIWCVENENARARASMGLAGSADTTNPATEQQAQTIAEHDTNCSQHQ